MADHSHHMHHGHHGHHMSDENDTTTETLFTDIPTTAATVLKAVMTTIMTHNTHHHPSTIGSHHAGHSLGEERMVNDATPDVHSQHVAGGDHNMPMYFHFGIDSIILFKEWTTSSPQSLIFSIIAIIILAMLYEGIKFFREFLFKKYFTSLEYSSVSVLGDDGKPVTEVHKVARNRMLSWPHLVQTFLHIAQMVLSYFLMLIFMTFNVWLCLAVIIGAGSGYFLFGWRKATVVDITEHCH